jgi:hypothetical protein
MLRPSVSQCVLVSGTPDQISLTARQLRVCWRRVPWQENESVVYNCYWPSPTQSFSDPNSAGLTTIFYWLRFKTLQTWRARSPYLYPPGTGWPSYRVPFSVASYDSQGLQRRYSNRLYMGIPSWLSCIASAYPQKLTLTSPTSGDRSVGIVLSRTKSHGVLQNATLGYGFHFQHRNSRAFPIESLAHDSGHTLVCAEYGYPKGSPNINS